MNTYAKGYRNEKKAMAEFESRGFICHRAKITRFNKNDFFECFDFVAIKNYSPNYWVQVKSNRCPKKDKDMIAKFKNENFIGTKNVAVIMIWKDNKGWDRDILTKLFG